MADEEFARFYAASYRSMVAQLFVLIGVFADAEEVAQEAYLRALRRWPEVRRYDSPEAWVRRVGINLSRDRARRRRRAADAMRKLGPPAPAQPVSVEDIALMDALRALPVHYREVIVLHYVMGMTTAEIAAQLRAPTGTVKTQLARGRRRLAVLLGDLGDEAAAVRGLVGVDRGGS